MLESEIEYFETKVGEDMPNEWIGDYLGAAAYTYDRSAYDLFRPPFEDSFGNFTLFVNATYDSYFG